MNFERADGGFHFERAQDVLVDTTDGYLSNINEINYVGAGSGLRGALGLPTQDDSADVDEVGSQLLSSLSNMHSIVLDRTIKEKDEEYVLHRLAKTTATVSKLSDEYAAHDRLYAGDYHDDIIDLCQAINDAHNGS